jgi:hypothetical protein
MATDPHPGSAPSPDAVRAALATVNDPEIHKPITDLGMVKSVDIADGGAVRVGGDDVAVRRPADQSLGVDHDVEKSALAQAR